MYPVDGVRSQLEWNSGLTTEIAPVTDDSNKYHRKVRWSLQISGGPNSPDLLADRYYRHHRYVLCASEAMIYVYRLSGPKVNTVEKLAELRKAGVNVGQCHSDVSQ